MSEKAGLVLVGLSAVGFLVGISSCWNIKIDMTEKLGFVLVGMSTVGLLVGAKAYTYHYNR